MNSTLLKKYETIDQSKVSEKDKKVLEQVKKLTNSFEETDEAKNKVAEKILDQITTLNPDAIKKPQVVAQKVAKVQKVAKAKKITKAKASATTSTTKGSGNNIMSVAKEIQKAGESWKDAMERAKQVLKERKEGIVEQKKTELEKLFALVKTKKELQGFTKSDIQRDAVRDAKPRGARFVTKEGSTSNAYGTFPNKLGRKYWETRDRHADRLAPNYPKDMPLLASGGAVSDAPFSVEVFKTKLRFDNELISSSKGDFPTFAKAKEFAIDMIDSGNYYAYINSKNGYLWGVSSKGVEQFADGGMFNTNVHSGTAFMDNTSFAKGGKVKHIFEVGQTISYPITKSTKLDKAVKNLFNKYAEKELVIDEIITDKPYNTAKVSLKSTGEKLTGEVILNPRYITVYPDSNKDEKNLKIKDWYTKTYPTDDLGEELDDKNTFADIWTALNNRKNVYDVLGVGDSLIRERVFEKVSEINGVDYDYVYKKWLDSDDYADGGNLDDNWELKNIDSDEEGSYGKVVHNGIEVGDYEWDRGASCFWVSNPTGGQKALDTPEELFAFYKAKGFAKGGNITNEEKLLKELHKLQRELNSSRLSTYRQGDTSEEEVARQRERESKLARFNEVLVELRAMNSKMADGGSLPYMTDPNFGDFQNTGAFANGGSIGDLTEQEFLKKYFGVNVFTENPSQYFEIKKMSSSNDDKVDAFVKELKADGFTVKKRAYSDFTSVMGVKKKASFADGGSLKKGDVIYIDMGYGDGVERVKVMNDFKAGISEVKFISLQPLDSRTAPYTITNTRLNKVIVNKDKFELGGAFVMTDLAGHTGGSDGLGNPMPLSGVSGTHYTGLVGETGAMSSGELFMDGGAMAQNQQVIDGASQPYVITEAFGNPAQHLAKGGTIVNQYEGKYYGDIWDNEWNEDQKHYFLTDHKNEIGFEEILNGESTLKRATKRLKTSQGNDAGFQLVNVEKLINTKSSELPRYVKFSFEKHIREGQYANGGSLGKALYVEYSSYFDYNKYDTDKIISALEGIGAKNIRLENDRGWSNQPEVVVFNGSKNQAVDALNEAFDTDYIRVSEKDWRTKKMADGGFTPDVSDGTQFMSRVYADGGSVEEGDRVTITTNSLGKDYVGMSGTITSRKLLNDKYSVKLSNGLEMAFSKDEFKHNSINPRFAKGGFVGTVEFNAGDIVWQKDEKRYGTVMNNYGDPINGDGGDLRLDTTGNTNIFTYNKKYDRTGYNLVKAGEKGDAGKLTPEVLTEMKASAKRLIESRREAKDKNGVAYYQEVYKRLLGGEYDSMTGAKVTASNKKGSSDYTYVPNKDIKELSVVVKGELKKLMGSDILDGVYVKNSGKSALKVDANAVFAKILKDAKEAKVGKSKKFEASDLKKLNLDMVQKLADAGYTEQQIRNIIFGYAFDNEIVAENELEYDNGIFSYEESYVKTKVDSLVEAKKNNEFALGIEYPDFDWQGIIKKYKISSKSKDLTQKRKGSSGGSSENFYEVFIGENIVVGHNYGYKWLDADGKVLNDYLEKDKKVSDPTKQNAWQKERGQKAGFNGGYWYVISSKIEIIDDVLKTLLSQKDGYCKEVAFYDETFTKTLKENKIDFADGGSIGNGKNGYIAFYKGKRIEVYADTIYQAQKTASEYFKTKKGWEVNVVLAEVNGKPYVRDTLFADGGGV